ncbi:MAG TPA: hypothetical protein VFL88_06135 [Gemmatimonadales bacterium]|jgi:hypothetical protein|nr:hypothetical protein [Gemmatimonadales bacterium]
MFRRHVVLSCALLLLAAACKQDADDVQPPTAGEAFSSIILPPDATVESKSGSADALQLVFHSTATPNDVAQFYRSQFSRAGWSIVSDLTDSAGVIAMHVDWSATNQPMWVRIIPADRGTRVELFGAVPDRDTSYVRRSAAAKDSSNSLRPR